ncbi:MAG: PH domain-containing protein [Actinomycetota bacterium]
MPYPRRLLKEGEDVALDLKPHWWFFSKQILVGIPLWILFLLLFTWSGGTLEDVSWWVWAVVALVWAGWLAIKWLDWRFTHFVVTSDRVISRTGVLAKRGTEIPLDRINNINFSQGVWERIIGAGTLDVESAGQDGQSTFSDVQHPDAVQQEIYRQIEVNQRTRASWSAPAAAAAAASSAPVSESIPDQLQKLAELRDNGVISAAEFEAKKAQLLERM